MILITLITIISFVLAVFLFIAHTHIRHLEHENQELKEKNRLSEVDKSILMAKFSEDKDTNARDKIVFMAQNLYENNPAEAFDFLHTMVENTNPKIRSNAVKALAVLHHEETFKMLFKLHADPERTVKSEVLKYLKELQAKAEKGDMSIDALHARRIKELLEQEKSKKEWII